MSSFQTCHVDIWYFSLLHEKRNFWKNGIDELVMPPPLYFPGLPSGKAEGKM
jgi:hypothetical protein